MLERALRMAGGVARAMRFQPARCASRRAGQVLGEAGRALLCASVGAGIALPLHAQAADTYPSHPIRLIVPSGPGGNTDTFARLVTEKLHTRLGQAVIVDNHPGASGIVGTDLVAKSAPDGYTLLMAFPSHPVNPSLYKDLPYDTIRDFAPITMVTSVTQVLVVTPSLNLATVKDLVTQAKLKPGQFNHGVVGSGSLGDLAARALSAATGAQFTQVPYKGAPQIVTAVISGEIQAYFSAPVAVLPQIKAGRVRALGVSTKRRLAILPAVPTIAESGVPGYEVVGWNGVLAPAKTPPAIIGRLHREIVAVLHDPEVEANITSQGIEPIGNTPAEFARILQADVARWGKMLAGTQAASVRQ
ncbi:MAG: transporter [Betaproteobacteria bacterium]|nr:transporter [Betaproteobacteria bacterium]